MATVEYTLEEASKRFDKLSLQKSVRQKVPKAPFTVDSKHVTSRRKHDKENYPRCKAALTFSTPQKSAINSLTSNGVSPFFILSPVNQKDDVITIDDSLKLEDLDNVYDSFISRAKSPNSSEGESLYDDVEVSSKKNNVEITQDTKGFDKGVNLVLTLTADSTTDKNDDGVFSTAKKTSDTNYQCKILCELYGRACLTTPGLFKRTTHKDSIDENIAKVLDFDSCDDEENAPVKTPVKKPPKCPPAKTEQKCKVITGKAKVYNAVDIRDVKKYDFVQSLSDEIPMWRCDEMALVYKNKFKQNRSKLTEKLFNIFSETVFESKLLESEIPVTWAAKLQKTAGQALNKRHRDGKRSSSIRLSEKVISNAAGLRDTLIHEMCHCASWIIDGEWKAGHGPVWKKWGAKVTRRYPLLSIKRCHNYDIQYKYTYKCVTCRNEIGRQSKSIDVDKERCDICNGHFELLLNRHLKSGTVVTTPASQRKVSGFALYVREYYATVKQDGRSHADTMKILARQYALLKAAGLT